MSGNFTRRFPFIAVVKNCAGERAGSTSGPLREVFEHQLAIFPIQHQRAASPILRFWRTASASDKALLSRVLDLRAHPSLRGYSSGTTMKCVGGLSALALHSTTTR